MKIAPLIALVALSGNAVAGELEDKTSEWCANAGYVLGSDIHSDCVTAMLQPPTDAMRSDCVVDRTKPRVYITCVTVLYRLSKRAEPFGAPRAPTASAGEAASQNDGRSVIRRLLDALLQGAAAYQASENAFRASHPPLQPPAAPVVCSSYVNGQYITTRCQ